MVDFTTDPAVPGMPEMPGVPYKRRSPYLQGCLVVGGLAAALIGGCAWWQRNHVPVYFDNGLAMPVTIAVDGASFPVPAGGREKRELKPGAHQVTVSGPQGEIERSPAVIPARSPVDDFLASRFFVYNVSEAHVYQLETLAYAERKEEQTYKRVLIGMQRFIQQNAVDYLFEPAPETVEASKGVVTRKTAFNVVPDGLVHLAFVRYKEGNRAEAETILRKEIGLTPCNLGARRSLINLLDQMDRPKDSLGVAKDWVTACPDTSVEPHRAYQNAAVAAGQRDALLKEYQARLTAHPESGANHYLYGRLLKDKDQALAEYDEAVRRDPKLAPAYAAKGFSLLGRERYAEALEALQSAIDLPGHDSQVNVLYARAAVGAGAVERAEVRLRREKDPEDPQALWRARWILALAAGRFDDAERLFDDRHPAETLSPDDWDLRVQLARLAGKKPDLDKLLAGARLRKDLALSLAAVHLDQALAEKRFRDASAVVDKELPPVHGRPTLSHVYGAAALLLAGDRQQADARLAELSTALGPGRPGEFNLLSALTEALQSPVPAADLIRAAGAADSELLPHVYFILGARAAAAGDAAAARGFFAKSQKTALTLDFPYLAAKALAE